MTYAVIEKIVPIFMVIAIIGAIGIIGLYPVKQKYKRRKWRDAYMKSVGASITFTGLVPNCIWVLGRQLAPAHLLLAMLAGALPGLVFFLVLIRKHVVRRRYEEAHPEEEFDIPLDPEAEERRQEILRKRKERGLIHWLFKGDRD